MKTTTKVILGAIGTYIVADTVSIRLTKRNYLKAIEAMTELTMLDKDLSKYVDKMNEDNYDGSLNKEIIDVAKKYINIAWDFEDRASRLSRIKDTKRAEIHKMIGEVKYNRKHAEAIIKELKE